MRVQLCLDKSNGSLKTPSSRRRANGCLPMTALAKKATAVAPSKTVRFIQWKPTILLSLAAAAFLGSMVLGKQPLARRMLEAVFTQPLPLAARTWLLINSLWVGWLAFLAAANIYVARNFDENIWVNFKVFGITVAMLVFMVPQVIWLSGKTKTLQSDQG